MKHSYEFIYNYFKENDCELLEKEYKHCEARMQYRCNCGNISYIQFNNFQQGQRCQKCGHKKSSNTKTHKYEYVYEFFKQNDCELLEDTYVGNKSNMKYRCSCGNISHINFSRFIQGQRCSQCGVEKRVNQRRLLYPDVYKYFLDNKCELLEETYINVDTKMKYICQCGNMSYITFDNFKQGKRCMHCSESKGEKQISLYLTSNNVKYKREYRFTECKSIRTLPFDFAIFDNDDQLQCLIEYDGEQHFKPIFGEKTFTTTIKNDLIKNNYCKQNNIYLFRIGYVDFNNINYVLGNILYNLSQNNNKKINLVQSEVSNFQ